MNPLFLLAIPNLWSIVIIVLVVVLLFGGRKIPELMRGMGQGMKEFKKATKDDEEPESAQKKEKAE